MMQLDIRSRSRTKKPTPTPSVVRNPTPSKNLQLLTTPAPCLQWHFICRYDTHTAQGNRTIAIPQKFFRCLVKQQVTFISPPPKIVQKHITIILPHENVSWLQPCAWVRDI